MKPKQKKMKIINFKILSQQVRKFHLNKLILDKGTVKWFNTTKGFGFITNEDTGKDLFVHIKECVDQGRELKEGDEVKFDVAQGQKGPFATNVKVN